MADGGGGEGVPVEVKVFVVAGQGGDDDAADVAVVEGLLEPARIVSVVGEVKGIQAKTELTCANGGVLEQRADVLVADQPLVFGRSADEAQGNARVRVSSLLDEGHDERIGTVVHALGDLPDALPGLQWELRAVAQGQRYRRDVDAGRFGNVPHRGGFFLFAHDEGLKQRGVTLRLEYKMHGGKSEVKVDFRRILFTPSTR